MRDDQRPEELEVIVLAAQTRSKVEIVEVVRNRLSLLCLDPVEQCLVFIRSSVCTK